MPKLEITEEMLDAIEAVKGVRELEKELATLKLRIKYLEGSVYK